MPRVDGLLGNRPCCVAGIDRDPVPVRQGSCCVSEHVQGGNGAVDHPQPPRVGKLGPEADYYDGEL